MEDALAREVRRQERQRSTSLPTSRIGALTAATAKGARAGLARCFAWRVLFGNTAAKNRAVLVICRRAGAGSRPVQCGTMRPWEPFRSKGAFPSAARRSSHRRSKCRTSL